MSFITLSLPDAEEVLHEAWKRRREHGRTSEGLVMTVMIYACMIALLCIFVFDCVYQLGLEIGIELYRGRCGVI